jgi:hypothetical protein
MRIRRRNKAIALLCFGVIFLGTSGLLATKSNFLQDILLKKSKAKSEKDLALFDISNLDSDSDGLSDKQEQELGTNPYNSDSDGDGYSDLEEVKSNHDPLKAETSDLIDEDGDGLTGEDEKKYGTNPKNKDTDFDGYTDGEEVISGHDPLVANFSFLDPALESMKKAEAESQTSASSCEGGNCSASSLSSTSSSAPSFNSSAVDLNQFSSKNLEGLFNAQNPSDLQSNLFGALGFDQSKLNYDQKVNLPEVSQDEIKISKDTSRQAIQDYFNILGIILYKKSPIRSTEEAQNYTQGLNIADSRQVEEMVGVAKQIKNGFKAVEVPEKKELVDFHKKVVATVIYLEGLLSSLKNINYKSGDGVYVLVNLLPKYSGLNHFAFSELLPEAKKLASDFKCSLPDRNFLEKYK